MVEILGIKISTLDETEVMKKIAEYLDGDNARYAVTPNPEIILHSLRDEEYKQALNSADFALADGFGLILAARLRGEKLPRITGADISLKILELADRRQAKALIFNWRQGLSSAQEIEAAIKTRYPNLNTLVLDIERNARLSEDIQEKIRLFAPSLIFSAIGFPEQEKLIYQNIHSWPTVRFAIGVGGTFDFLTGKTKRAPRFWRQAGLEWLWRLIQQPRRLKRIYQATLVFIFKVFASRLKFNKIKK